MDPLWTSYRRKVNDGRAIESIEIGRVS
jgi:hypothetical protein